MLEVEICGDMAVFLFGGFAAYRCPRTAGLQLLRSLNFAMEPKKEWSILYGDGRVLTFPAKASWELLDLAPLDSYRGYYGLAALFSLEDGSRAWILAACNPHCPGEIFSCSQERLEDLRPLFPEMVDEMYEFAEQLEG